MTTMPRISQYVCTAYEAGELRFRPPTKKSLLLPKKKAGEKKPLARTITELLKNCYSLVFFFHLLVQLRQFGDASQRCMLLPKVNILNLTLHTLPLPAAVLFRLPTLQIGSLLISTRMRQHNVMRILLNSSTTKGNFSSTLGNVPSSLRRLRPRGIAFEPVRQRHCASLCQTPEYRTSCVVPGENLLENLPWVLFTCLCPNESFRFSLSTPKTTTSSGSPSS